LDYSKGIIIHKSTMSKSNLLNWEWVDNTREEREQVQTSLFEKSQMHINRLPLPMDVVNIIKDYLFYDIPTARIISESKRCKYHTHLLINSAVSRSNSFEEENDIIEEEDGEYWVFGFQERQHEHERLQMQAINCKKCGEYILSILMIDYHIQPQIVCRCTHWQDTLESLIEIN